MHGLASLGWRSFLRRRARYALTALGVVLGVANLFGVLVTNESTNQSLDQDRSVFGADVSARRTSVVGAGLGAGLFTLKGFDPPQMPQTRGTATLWHGFDTISKGKRSATLGAIDGAGSEMVLAPRLEEGRLPRAGRPEAVLSRSAIRMTGIDIGERWTTDLSRFAGKRRPKEFEFPLELEKGAPEKIAFTITGVVEDPARTGPDFSFGSFASLEYVWSIVEPDYATEVRFQLDEGVDPFAWVAERKAALPDFEFQAFGLAPEFKRFLDILQGSMSGAAAIAVFIGAFLIYLTFSMTVVERTRVYGTLHAVGATGRQVARAVLIEAAVLGVIATAVGLILGTIASLGLLQLVSRAVRVSSPPLHVSPGAVTIAVVVGISATLAGSFIPARRAGRLSPVEAMRGTPTATPKRSLSWIAGVGFLGVGLAISASTRGIRAPSILSQSATLLVLLGAVLLVPPLIGPAARAGRALLRGRANGVGQVAVMHLVREPSRSAYTVGLIMVVLAMMLAVSSTHLSLGASIEDWVDKRFGADLIAYRPGIPAKAEKVVRQTRGVAAATSMTFGPQIRMTSPEERAYNLILIDPDAFFDLAGFPWADGDDASARAALRAGGAVLLPATRSDQEPIARGDSIAVNGVEGRVTYKVAGTYASIAMGPEVGLVAPLSEREALGASRDRNVLYINYEDGAQPGEVRNSVDEALAGLMGKFHEAEPGSESGFFFASGAELKAQARREVQNYFNLFYAVLLVAVIVGLLGLANTMATSVIRRYREIGVLHAIGAEPRVVSRMILIESATLVGVAFVLSLVLGTVIARLIVDGAGALLGFHVSFVFPVWWVPILAVLGAGVALAASIAPARRASRLTPVEALRFE